MIHKKSYSKGSRSRSKHQRSRSRSSSRTSRNWGRISRHIYIGGLTSSTKEKVKDIETHFSNFGQIHKISMKKGFCFVEYAKCEDAAYACSKMNGRFFMGDCIKVEISWSTPSALNEESKGKSKSSKKRSGSRSRSTKARTNESNNTLGYSESLSETHLQMEDYRKPWKKRSRSRSGSGSRSRSIQSRFDDSGDKGVFSESLDQTHTSEHSRSHWNKRFRSRFRW